MFKQYVPMLKCKYVKHKGRYAISSLDSWSGLKCMSNIWQNECICHSDLTKKIWVKTEDDSPDQKMSTLMHSRTYNINIV